MCHFEFRFLKHHNDINLAIRAAAPDGSAPNCKDGEYYVEEWLQRQASVAYPWELQKNIWRQLDGNSGSRPAESRVERTLLKLDSQYLRDMDFGMQKAGIQFWSK